MEKLKYKLKLKINPITIICFFLFVFFCWNKIILTFSIVAILHELAHYITARFLGYKFKNISLMPYGAGLVGNCNLDLKDEIKIALAGPLLNLVFCFITISLFWLFPKTYAFLSDFLIANFSLFIYNILPVYPLDIGRIVYIIAKKYNKEHFFAMFTKIFSIISFLIFFILFLFSLKNKPNYTLLFSSIFMLLSSKHNHNNSYFENSYKYLKKKSSSMVIKNIYVDITKEINIFKLTKFLSKYDYKIFYLFKNNKLIKMLTEDQIIEILDKNKLSTNFFQNEF